ncbi:hypothetical protein SAMN04488028_104205 [Reichenbachiella agariperforans]|uniref:DUF4136 domain-containing protein n=1 Tax=Reichenbachiella agariperforans TaxID=156994 RepID=A0A1M6RK70_REIAG|nr:hypothetical protein [Reichenbachiella agariperforans]SHK32758.1 hypothetical protein SAMN04488028_104205 [Reichenbachiella agariperforans]
MTLLKKLTQRSHKLLMLTLMGILLHGCTPALVSWTNPTYLPHDFKKVIVFGMFQRLDTRLAFEEAVVDALLDLGYPAAHGMTLIPPSFEITSNEHMQRIIKKENFDLVIMASAVDQKTETQYHSNYNGPYAGGAYGGYGPYGYDMYNYYNYRYGYNVYYGGYGYGWQDPGYYTEQTQYLIECQVYDLGENTNPDNSIIWTGQSQLIESSNMRTLAARYAKILLKDLENNKILK